MSLFITEFPWCRYTYWMLFLFVIVSCESKIQQNEQKDKSKEKKKSGIVKTHRKDKSLLSECNYKEGIRHGLCRNYYPNGKVQTELNYVEGKKQNEGKMYYESGKIYLLSPYLDDKIHGLQKVYHENGNLMAEIPYYKDELGKGLKEYTLSGKLKDHKPVLVISPKDNIKVNGEYYLNLSISGEGNYKSIEFYQGNLTEGEYMNKSLVKLISNKGKAQFKLKLPPNTYIMEKFNFIAKVETNIYNFYIIEQSHNVAIENRIK